MNCGLIVALDTPSLGEARQMVEMLDDSVFFYKVGLRLLLSRGAHAFIDDLVEHKKRVFLDYKFYDIPQTVREAVANVAGRGIDMVTVHGDDAQIVAAAVEGVRGTFTQVMAVTVLTSQDAASLLRMGYTTPPWRLVSMRAQAAQEAGAHGVIASPLEITQVRAVTDPNFLVVTPGIRLQGAVADDQKRIATPDEAARLGADFVVVGRPIIHAENPVEAARTICDMLGHHRLPPS